MTGAAAQVGLALVLVVTPRPPQELPVHPSQTRSHRLCWEMPRAGGQRLWEGNRLSAKKPVSPRVAARSRIYAGFTPRLPEPAPGVWGILCMAVLACGTIPCVLPGPGHGAARGG